jgi:hypothetical protein
MRRETTTFLSLRSLRSSPYAAVLAIPAAGVSGLAAATTSIAAQCGEEATKPLRHDARRP